MVYDIKYNLLKFEQVFFYFYFLTKDEHKDHHKTYFST